MRYAPDDVHFGIPSDIDSWMQLVRLIRTSFPGLETEDSLADHRATVLRFMGKCQALCVKDGEDIAGVLLFSRGHSMICCLGVHPDCRRCGAASALLTRALQELDRTKPITVSTFRQEDEKGPAPRALYRKFGFVPDALIEELGYPNQRFVLHPDQQA